MGLTLRSGHSHTSRCAPAGATAQVMETPKGHPEGLLQQGLEPQDGAQGPFGIFPSETREGLAKKALKHKTLPELRPVPSLDGRGSQGAGGVQDHHEAGETEAKKG